MAKTVIATLTDDIDGGTKDVSTYGFGWLGRDYEVDLSAKNSKPSTRPSRRTFRRRASNPAERHRGLPRRPIASTTCRRYADGRRQKGSKCRSEGASLKPSSPSTWESNP